MSYHFVLGTLCVYPFIYGIFWRKKGLRAVLYSLFYFYACAVFYLTMLPFPQQWGREFFDGDLGNFIPFRDLKMGYGGALKDILLNILMTVPFGILFPQIRNNKVISTVLIGFFASCLIEGAQLMMTLYGSPYHAFDVTDVISNTAGCLLGYLCYITATLKDPKR